MIGSLKEDQAIKIERRKFWKDLWWNVWSEPLVKGTYT